MVEFSISITLFLVLLMGIIDLGRGVYMYNGVSEAAREIARVASVHPGAPLGASPEIASVVATQQRLIPALRNPTFGCFDVDGSNGFTTAGRCPKGDQVRVTIVAPYTPVTPLLGLVGTWDMRSSGSARIP